MLNADKRLAEARLRVQPAWLQQRYGDVDTRLPSTPSPAGRHQPGAGGLQQRPRQQASEAVVLDALTKGEFVNELEKRYAVATNAVSDAQRGYQSIETYGPFKRGRENSVTDASVELVDGGMVLHGYDKAMNVNAPHRAARGRGGRSPSTARA